VTTPPRTTPVGHRPSTKIPPGLIAVVGFAALVAAYFWFIAAFGANTIWEDQWSDLILIQHAYSGHLTLSALWAQHNENRILFPNLVVLLLAEVTHFNVKAEEFLSGLTLVGATAVLILGHRRRSPATPWTLYVPVAIVMLSFVGYGNALWGFQFAWYLVLLALSVALVLCDHPRWGWLVFTGAIVAGVVGSYSSLPGLLIWPAGLLILLLCRRSPLYWLAWIGTAALTTALYFVNYHRQLGVIGDNYVFHHPIQGLRFFLFSVGNVFGSHGGDVAVVLGILIVGTALWLAVSSVLQSRDEAAPLGVGLICFGLLFALMITTGRSAAGLDAGGASRYTTFDLLTLVGCYLLILSRVSATSRTRRNEGVSWWASTIIVGIAICLVLVPGTTNGLDGARSWQASQNQASRVIVNMKAASDEMVERILIGVWFLVPQTRGLVSFAQQNHLTLFASSSTVEDLVRAGLPYSHSSLTTTLVNGKNDATVRGVVYLIASAQGDYGVAKVYFEILGPSGSLELVNATDTHDYGWIGGWDTTPLPAGRYRVRSVAYDHASDRATSLPLTVNIENQPG